MRVVFDTNVLISAYLSVSGTSQIALGGVLKKHASILSDYILMEFRKTLVKKINVSELIADSVISGMKQDMLVLENVSDKGIQFSDKKDIPILALTRAASANVLITGDKHLLALKRFFKAVILTPREALEII